MILIDAQLPPRLARWFAEQGVEARHVGAVMGDPAASDAQIWQQARQPGWMILTKDQDFVDRGLLFGPPPIVCHLRLGNCANADLIAHLARCWPLVSRLTDEPHAAVITIEREAVGLHTAAPRD